MNVFSPIWSLRSVVLIIVTITGRQCWVGLGCLAAQFVKPGHSWQLSTWQKLQGALLHDLSPVCVKKPPPVTAPNVHLCVCRVGVCVCVRLFRRAVLLNYLCAFYSKAPPPFSFHLSPRLNICLSIHGWICIPLRRAPGRLMVCDWEGREWGQSPHLGLLFLTSGRRYWNIKGCPQLFRYCFQ